MDYNSNTYVTISQSSCETIGIIGSHRMNNDKTICIIEFKQGEEIPLNVQNNAIDYYTHEEVLWLVKQAGWKSTYEA